MFPCDCPSTQVAGALSSRAKPANGCGVFFGGSRSNPWNSQQGFRGRWALGRDRAQGFIGKNAECRKAALLGFGESPSAQAFFDRRILSRFTNHLDLILRRPPFLSGLSLACAAPVHP